MEQTGNKQSWTEAEVFTSGIWKTSGTHKNSVVLDIIVAIKAITIEQVLQYLGVSGLHTLYVSLLAVHRSLSRKDSQLHIKTKFT